MSSLFILPGALQARSHNLLVGYSCQGQGVTMCLYLCLNHDPYYKDKKKEAYEVIRHLIWKAVVFCSN